MIIYLTTYEFRQVPGLKHIYFVYQEYFICAISYNSVYYFLYIRCTGIIFLSINRCLVICGPTSIVTCWIQKAHTWQIVVVYWTVPTLISIFVLKDTDFYYDSLETMEVVVPRSVIMVGAICCFFLFQLLRNPCLAIDHRETCKKEETDHIINRGYTKKYKV
uniref:Serpentine receptor class gamma n=1 Tax=Caenorhabditis japonica TaxID=281687 RepID=A0A8R1HYN8_CAEJA